MNLLSNKIKEMTKVTDDELQLILSKFKSARFKKDEFLIFSEQEQNQKMFFVRQGCLRIFFVNKEGIESTRHLIFENHFATTLTNFITDLPSLEYIQALENCDVNYILKKDFFGLLETIPCWEIFYRKYLEYAYVTNTSRLESFITLSALKRYKLLLNQNPVIVRRLSNKIVASYLSISQETLSRLKSKL